MARSLDQLDDTSAGIQGSDFGVGYRPGSKGTRFTFLAFAGWIQSVLANAFASIVHTHTADSITDATAAGKTLVRAADAVAQRSALGLGTAATEASSVLLARANHTGVMALTGLAQGGATDLQVLAWSASQSQWLPMTISGIGSSATHRSAIYLLNPDTGNYLKLEMTGTDDDPAFRFVPSGSSGGAANENFTNLWIRNGTTGNFVRYYLAAGGTDDDPNPKWGTGTPGGGETTFSQLFQLNTATTHFIEWVVSGSDDSDPAVYYRLET